MASWTDAAVQNRWAKFELTLAFLASDGLVGHRGLPSHDGREDGSLAKVLAAYSISEISIGVPCTNIVIAKALDNSKSRNAYLVEGYVIRGADALDHISSYPDILKRR